MNKSEKLKRHGIVIRISGQYNQPWRGFTLQKGHLFGEDERGYFVSSARPGKRSGTIQIYRCDTPRGDYEWRLTVENIETETAKKIILAAGERAGRVEYEPVEKQVKRFYNPRLTSAPVRPMPHMRAPGGTYGTHGTRGYVSGKIAWA